VVVVSADNEGYAAGIEIAKEMRTKGLVVVSDLSDRKFAAQLKYADAVGARFALIIGKKEMEAKKYGLKDLKSGEQLELALPDIIRKARER
jgi:histidyl-tRNA synthetase